MPFALDHMLQSPRVEYHVAETCSTPAQAGCLWRFAMQTRHIQHFHTLPSRVCAIRGSLGAKLLHDLGVVCLIGGFMQLLFHHHVIAQHLFVHFLLQRLSFRLVITGIQQRF